MKFLYVNILSLYLKTFKIQIPEKLILALELIPLTRQTETETFGAREDIISLRDLWKRVILRQTLMSTSICREQRTLPDQSIAMMNDTDFHVTSAINVRVTSHLLNH